MYGGSGVSPNSFQVGVDRAVKLDDALVFVARLDHRRDHAGAARPPDFELRAVADALAADDNQPAPLVQLTQQQNLGGAAGRQLARR